MTCLEPDGERGCGEVGAALFGGRHQESRPSPDQWGGQGGFSWVTWEPGKA